MNNSYTVENGKGDIQQSWWKRRSTMEKKLTIFSASALLLIVILVIVLIIFFTTTEPGRLSKPVLGHVLVDIDGTPTTCLSASCVHTTSELLEHMDNDVNPCDNFYDFACGTFMDNVQLDDEHVKSVQSFLFENVLDRIQGIVEEEEEENDPRSIIMAKRLYSACMNLSAIEDRGLRLIKDSLRQMGGWPVLEGGKWNEKDFDWMHATYKLRELGYGFEFFIRMLIKSDDDYPSERIIELKSPWNPIRDSTPEFEEALFNFMVNVSVIHGADRNRAKDEYRDVIDFMKNLFRNPDEDKEDDKKHQHLSLSELKFKFREIPWMDYINRLQFPTENITHEQIFAVSDESYFLRLQNLLRRTLKRVIANYIAITTVIEQSSYLTSDVTDLVWKFSMKHMHQKSVPPRHKFCSHVVDFQFGLPLQAAYIRKHFSKEAKEHATEILNSIKEEFKEVITDLKWMDDETRNTALERISTGKQYVGYPNDLLSFDKVESRYAGFQMEPDNFLASILNANYYETNLRFKKLHEPHEKDEELNEEYTTYTQTYYSASDNIITVPAGLLQDLIYDKDRPQYMNYGALGSSIGHEIFHTVLEGKSCRTESKYYDWITTHTMLELNEKLSCVAMHYGKYFIPEIQEHLNSSNTKQEDLADIAGVKLAYQAYDKWVTAHGPEKKLPGFNYTPRQLFWISSAVRFCSKGTIEAVENSVSHSHQSLKKFRVLGTLRNLEEFSRDFNCPTDSYMYNDDKCEIW